MRLFPAFLVRRRAHKELQADLGSIFRRLEHLESEPISSPVKLEIEKHVAIQLGELSRELESVRGFSAGVHGQVGELEKKVEGWTLAIAEGIERVDRSERRIHATIKRARKELKALGYEDAGLEAEAAELRKVDGEGSTDGGVPDVQQSVEPALEEASSIRGVSAALLKRVRGF